MFFSVSNKKSRESIYGRTLFFDFKKLKKAVQNFFYTAFGQRTLYQTL